MYLNVVQLAESLGVEERQIQAWIRAEGLPYVSDRGRLLFDRVQVLNWATARGLGEKAGFLAHENFPRCEELQLDELLRSGGIWRNIHAAGVPEVIKEKIRKLDVAPAIRSLLVQRISTPDGITWAAVGGGIAFPHMRAPVYVGGEAGIIILIFLKDHLPVTAPDNEPIKRLFFFIAPSPRAHLEILAQLSALLRKGSLRQLLVKEGPDEEIYKVLKSRANNYNSHGYAKSA